MTEEKKTLLANLNLKKALADLEAATQRYVAAATEIPQWRDIVRQKGEELADIELQFRLDGLLKGANPEERAAALLKAQRQSAEWKAKHVEQAEAERSLAQWQAERDSAEKQAQALRSELETKSAILNFVSGVG